MPPAYLKGGSGVAVNPNAGAMCTGKIRFESAIVAARAAARRRNRESYYCRICGGFHVGTNKFHGVGNARQARGLVVKELK